jgi:hypothetical protein
LLRVNAYDSKEEVMMDEIRSAVERRPAEKVAADMGSGVLAVTFALAPEIEPLVNEWYATWHASDVLRVPGFTGLHRYRSLTEPLRHMTLWEVEDVAFPFSDEYRSYTHRSWRSFAESKADPSLRGDSERLGWREIPVAQVVGAGDGERIGPAGVRTITMEISPEHQPDFHRWYDEEHVPDLLSRGTHRSVRRFQVEGSDRFVAVWELNDLHHHLRDTYRPAPLSPWSQRIAEYRLGVSRDTWEKIVVAKVVA